MLTEELERLGRLRSEGILTEKEFLKAKALLLSPPRPQPGLNLLNWQVEVELERIDREWEQKQEKYKITQRFSRRVLPSRRSIAMNIVGILGSLIVTVLCITEFGAPEKFLGLGSLPIAVLSLCLCVEAKHYKNYQKANARYEGQRYDHFQRKP